MGSEKLAIHGGTPVLTRRFPSLGSHLSRGARCSYDLCKMLSVTLRGHTIQQVEGGVIGHFEREFCEFVGTEHALATSSGTAALHSAYFAAGVGPGTEVIVPSYTWHATATPILLSGAVPVFCEIDPVTLTADPDDVERRITERTRAISVLHAWGNPAPMDRFVEIARRRGVALIEDCSHAHGTTFQGRRVGSWGDLGCFSLGGAKPINGGEAGVVVTNDASYFDRMLLLGQNARVRHEQRAETFAVGDVSLGLKYRPHIAAMFLARGSLRRLERRNARAARVWQILCEELDGIAGIRPIPTRTGGVRGGFYFFVLAYEGAELGGPTTGEFVEAVSAEGVPIHLDEYRDCLLHRTPLFTELDRRQLGGTFYDPTRPPEDSRTQVSLPVTEGVTETLVRISGLLWAEPELYARGCARAIRKVLAALVP